jgi:5-methylcytosine-specific restriction endonuclease McrA
MMPVAPAAEPAEFDGAVRVPGLRSVYEKCGMPVPEAYRRTSGGAFSRVKIPDRDAEGNMTRRDVVAPQELPGSALEPYWATAIPWMLHGYKGVCAYCCFRIHPTGAPSVDHMVPKSRAWNQAYEWMNYRLAALRMNARKGDLLDIIDPFEVKAGWFAIELTLGQVVPGPAAAQDPALRKRVEDAIGDLRLNDFADERVRDIEAYEAGDVPLRRLREESPFVAYEIVRQGRLHREDRS